MATIRQIEANRRNAMKSTGPRSAEGKAASRFNAFKTGIDAQSTVIPGEDPRVLDELTAEYHERFRPATPDHRFLVDTLVNAEWQLRRLRQVEAQLWRCEWDETPSDGIPLWLGRAYVRSTDRFTRLQRRIDAAERAYRRALEKLERPSAAPLDAALLPSGEAEALLEYALACPPSFPGESGGPPAPAPQVHSPRPVIGVVPSAAKSAPLRRTPNPFPTRSDRHGAENQDSMIRPMR